MSKKVLFGDSIFDAADEADYVGNIGKRKRRRAERCQCDRDLTHGTCPGPRNCPYSQITTQEYKHA